MERTILHIDQNCFFASVEMLNRPELRDVPMAVGGDANKRHGIILAKNQKAAAYGVKTAEALWQAKEKCSSLVIVPGHYQQYEYYSRLLFELYCTYTDRVEPYGLDECWLDLTGTQSAVDPVATADEIRDKVQRLYGLTCSVGVSFNKSIAKLGSDYKKPNATTYIPESELKRMVWPLPVEALLFVGRSTQRKLNRINIKSIGDLARMSLSYIEEYLGRNGVSLWRCANGIDPTPVRSYNAKRDIKSVGNSTTTARDMLNDQDVWHTVVALSDQVATRLRKYQRRAQTIQIWVRDASLEHYEKQRRLPFPTDSADEIAKVAMLLFRESYDWDKPVRSLGVRGTQLSEEASPSQLSLFDMAPHHDQSNVDRVFDTLRMQFGEHIIKKAVQLQCDPKLIENGQTRDTPGGFSALNGLDRKSRHQIQSESLTIE